MAADAPWQHSGRSSRSSFGLQPPAGAAYGGELSVLARNGQADAVAACPLPGNQRTWFGTRLEV